MTVTISTPGMEGLRTDQAPPLSIPASFFLLAPLSMMASGAVIACGADSVFATRWSPLAMAATHLGTLGFLGSIMMGALYQMIPVVAGSPVPLIRLAHVVHVLFFLGVAALVVGLGTAQSFALLIAPALLGGAFLMFVIPAAIALVRAPTRNETVAGMRLATFGLVLQSTIGVLLAEGRAGHPLVHNDWLALVASHAALGFAVWIGGLLAAVSWQVVPMFYLTPSIPRWSQRATVATLGLAILAIAGGLIFDGSPAAVGGAALPLAVLVWWVHPVVTLRAIHRRGRKKTDGSVRFFWAGLVAAPAIPLLAVGSAYGDSPCWSVALGWVVVWGWAGMIAHGMLTRIVPFLVWFHRYASLVGERPVPTMRGLLPDSRVRVAMAFHASTVVVGLSAIATGSVWGGRITGTLLFATGALLGANLVHTLRPRPLPSFTPP